MIAPLSGCTASGVSGGPADAGVDAGMQEPVEEGTYFVRDDDGRVLIFWDATLEHWEANRSIETAEQKAPLLLGEWGFDPDWPNADLFMRELLDMSDRMMLGWTYWSYDPGGWGIWERSEEGEVVERDNPGTRTFELAFDPSPSATLPTEIYVPATRHYPDGWSLTGCDEVDGCSSAWSAGTEMLEIFTPNRTARVDLRIAPSP